MKHFTFLALIAAFLFISASSSPLKKVLKKTDFTYIPSGSYTLDDKPISVFAFIMLNHEVTNAEYRSFLLDNYVAKGDTIGFINALPDTSAWSPDTTKRYNEPYKNLYFSHPAYNNYPVVNISKENADNFCVWLTKKMCKDFPETTFNDFRLPTRPEWVMAAKGGLNKSPYPWGGPYTRNTKGCYLANFNSIGEHNLKADENGNPIVVDRDNFKVDISADFTYGPVQTKTFQPNGYELYNMAGNVAEMVSNTGQVMGSEGFEKISNTSIAMGGHWNSYGNDIQVTSSIPFVNANPMVGFRPIMSYSFQKD